MRLDPFRIVIPSYKRSSTIAVDGTLACLAKVGVPAELIDLVVADEDEEAVYTEAVPRDMYGRLVVGVPGLVPVRRHVVGMYPPGSRVVSMDDDVESIHQLTSAGGKNVLTQVQSWNDLRWVVSDLFDVCEAAGARLWGVSPTTNPFFMSHGPKGGNYFAVGWMFGMLIKQENGPLCPEVELNKEDYQRTLQCIEADGLVVRANHLACTVPPYGSNVGGLQVDADGNPAVVEGAREQGNRAAAEYLLQRFPGLVRVNTRRKPVGTEVLLTPKRVF